MANKVNLRLRGILNQELLLYLVFAVMWTVVFTLAYAQSPLFTSNQNQYFIHGLAKAGYGYLDQDWLAQTLDPTPVFSGLVALSYRLFRWMPVFYFQFALLAGIYILSLNSILSQTLQLENSVLKRWGYLLALVLLHSAALRYLVVHIFNPNWVYLFDGGVAGQRLLGSVLQPSAFGVFLLLAIANYLRGSLTFAMISLAVAATFHPTYLLSAVILTFIIMSLEYSRERNISRPLAIGIGALVSVSPVLFLTLRTFGGTDPLLAARARELLVNFRIPHHAIPAVWFEGSVVVKGLFIILALILTSKTPLFHFLLWPSIIAVLGTFLQVISGSTVLALLFPWRLSTWLVPLSTGIILFWSLERIWPKVGEILTSEWIIILMAVTILSLVGTGLSKSCLEYRERVNGKDRPIMAHIQEAKQPSEVYLVPLDMQDFRLETGAPAYVEFKSIPYKDTDVLEWYRRVSLAGELYRAPYKRKGCQVVSHLAGEGVTQVILPYDHILQTCENLERGYWDWDFVLYEVMGE